MIKEFNYHKKIIKKTKSLWRKKKNNDNKNNYPKKIINNKKSLKEKQ